LVYENTIIQSIKQSINQSINQSISFVVSHHQVPHHTSKKGKTPYK